MRPSPPTPNCVLFQSTPPARGATPRTPGRRPRKPYFNPRPPRGGRQRGGQGYDQADNFNPRPPRGGRRAGDVLTLQVAGISIHAPREGGDPKACCRTCASFVFQSTPPARGATARLRPWRCAASDFNPRPPRGGRPAAGPGSFRCLIFQSTPPARGATIPPCGSDPAGWPISIHAPREGGDLDFLSTVLDFIISIHAPREGGDSKDAQFYL